MSKITLPLFVLALLPVGVSARDGVRVLPTSEKRPNVLVIMTDDVGYGDFSCYGAKRVHTPNIDRLAANGVRFTDAHACASTSTPSRYGFLTGEYPFRRPGTDVAAGNAAMVIRPEQFTLADLFKAAGYTTAAIGKWHLGLGSRTAQQDWNGQIDFTPADLGFDYSCIMAATADRVPCVFIENGRVRNYDASAPIQVSYRSNFSGEPTGKSNPELLRLRPSHGHDMSIVNGISRIGFMKGGGKALWKDENIADSIADYALRWITATQQPEDSAHRPFFMYLCTNDVHVPRWPHERFRGQSPMGLRGDAIVQLDWTVGQIMDGLHKLGIADNTLVILTSDNGPVLDDGYADDAESLAGTHRPGGPWRGGKYSAFEAGSAVPFIVSWPAGGVRRGGESRALISLIDGVRSLAPIAGVELNDTLACDSRNFCDTWLGRSGEPRDYILSMAYNREVSLRTPRWKYIPAMKGPAMVPWGPKIETGFAPEAQLYDLSFKKGENKKRDRKSAAGGQRARSHPAPPAGHTLLPPPSETLIRRPHAIGSHGRPRNPKAPSLSHGVGALCVERGAGERRRESRLRGDQTACVMR